MLDISALNASLSFWDKAAYVALVAVFIGVVGESILELTSWIKSERAKATVGKVSAIILIAGLGGDIATHAKTSEFNSKIVALLHLEASNADDRAGLANKAAGKAILDAGNANERAALANKEAGAARKEAEQAHERAEVANKEAEHLRIEAVTLEGAIAVLKGQNDALEAKNLGLEKEQQKNAANDVETKRKVGNIEKRTDDRNIKDSQRRIVLTGIKGHKRPLTVILLDDREPREYGKLIASLLTDAQYAVQTIDLKHSSPLTGVIVCNNGFRPLKLFKILEKAQIATDFKRSSTEFDPNRIAECQASPMFPSQDVPEKALRIFVGQRGSK